MLTIKLDGGLGNQMFQYAFIKSIAHARTQPFELDISTYIRDKKRGVFELEHLNIPKVFKSTSSLSTNLFFLRILRKLSISKFGRIFIETSSSYSPLPFKTTCDYFYGYFQSFKYFDHRRDALLQEFEFCKGQQSAYFKPIINSESVGIHVRKGDYVSNKRVFNLMFQLEKDYYLAASKKMAVLTQKPLNFFLFSNDHDWVKAHLLPELEKFGQCTVVDHHKITETSLYDFECLKNCKHQITANSSFSWWAAYLNQYEKKRVIAPKQWYKQGQWNSLDFYPSDWIKI